MRNVSVGILVGLLCAGCSACRSWSGGTSMGPAGREFQHLVWHVAEGMDLFGSEVVLWVQGMFETNSYRVVIPEAGPPLIQTQHVVSVSGPSAQDIGSITGVCYQTCGLLHFPEGDCLFLHDLIGYVGGSGKEFQDTFVVFNRGRVVRLRSHKGNSEFGDRTCERVESSVAVRGREILVRRRHAAFKDWWEAMQANETRRRLVEERSELRTYVIDLRE